jgi:L-rhamnose mutarotase
VCLRLAILSHATDSIHLTMHPRPTLFANFKYVGEDYEADMKKMASNEKVREWWQVTDHMQESPVAGAKGSAHGPWWEVLEEVFRLE